MRATALRDEFERKMPQCQAYRTGRYYNDKPDTDFQCSHRARFLVAGRFYCLRHAEIKALEILMNEQEA